MFSPAVAMATKFPKLEGYTVRKLLGGGAFGKVYLGVNARNESVAIKQVKKQKVTDQYTLREIFSMQRVKSHPNVIKLHEFRETTDSFFIVMEVAPNGELFDYIGQGLPEAVGLYYFRQLAAGVEHIHNQGLCHRDLKLENVLLDGGYNMKICDFGFAKVMVGEQTGPQMMFTMCGSPAYVAPEILLGQGYDGAKADIWSCGVILMAMMCACLPVQDRAWQGDPLFDRLVRYDYSYEPWGTLLKGPCEDLCKRMLDPNPATRWTWPQIKQHPWFLGASVRVAPSRDVAVYLRGQKPVQQQAVSDEGAVCYHRNTSSIMMVEGAVVGAPVTSAQGSMLAPAGTSMAAPPVVGADAGEDAMEVCRGGDVIKPHPVPDEEEVFRGAPVKGAAKAAGGDDEIRGPLVLSGGKPGGAEDDVARGAPAPPVFDESLLKATTMTCIDVTTEQLVERLRSALTARHWMVKWQPEAWRLKAKQMTPRGPVKFVVELYRAKAAPSIVADCTRTKGDALLFHHLLKELRPYLEAGMEVPAPEPAPAPTA